MIVSTGEALIDFISRADTSGDEVFKPSPGGSPYNTAVAIARLKAPVAYLARMSTDIFGDMLWSHLDDNGVDTSLIARTDEPSTLAFVRHGAAGGPEYAFYANGTADRNLAVEDVPSPLSEDVDCIQCGSISLCLEPSGTTIEGLVLREARDRFVCLDPNIRPGMVDDESAHRRRIERLSAASGLLKVSDEDLSWLYPDTDTESGAKRLLDCGATLVVITAGTSDARLVRADGLELTVPVREVDSGDTVGAGDTLHAGLIAWLSRHDALSRDAVAGLSESDLRHALEFAIAAAAVTCSRVGADPPTLEEVPGDFG